MPLIKIRRFPIRLGQEQKPEVANDRAAVITRVFGCDIKAISVILELASPPELGAKVFGSEIAGRSRFREKLRQHSEHLVEEPEDLGAAV